MQLFPMDDAYIHLVYARNIANYGQLTFNYPTLDTGIGTSSILWTLLLAGSIELGLSPILAAQMLGALAYFLTIALSYWLAKSAYEKIQRKPVVWQPILIAMLVACSGNLIWFSASGMETMLWLALGLCVIKSYLNRRFTLLGVFGGLLLLTRIEGLLLLATISLVDVWQRKGVNAQLIGSLALAGLILTPWLGYTFAHTGHLLPTTFAGKSQAHIQAAQTISGGFARWLIYPSVSLGYFIAFVFGGVYLPGPKLAIPGQLGAQIGGLAILAFIALALTLFVSWAAVRKIKSESKYFQEFWLIIAGWLIFHNLAYWIALPTPGTASRYQVLNHWALWVLVGFGLTCIAKTKQRLFIPLFVAAALVNSFYWQQVYNSNLRHMSQVRLTAATWVNKDLPRDAVVAVHDIGATGWIMRQSCFDLGGLIDEAFNEYRQAGRLTDLLRERQVQFIVLPTKHSSENQAIFDYRQSLGLIDQSFILKPIKHFENDYDDWRFGALPTWNALPAVTIYKLQFLEPTPP